MDRSLHITWYDLAEADRAAHLEWLHGSFIPRQLHKPGVLWAAHYASESNVAPLGGGKGRVSKHAGAAEVPQGDGYIAIFGAASPYVFADPGRAALHAALTDADRAMRALRSGERSNGKASEIAHGKLPDRCNNRSRLPASNRTGNPDQSA